MSVYRIVVMQGWQQDLAHQILSGIVDFSMTPAGSQMEIMTIPWDPDAVKKTGAGWEVDGFITSIRNEELYRTVLDLGWKTINTHVGMDLPDLPQVDADHYKTGRLAAEHFIKQGFEHFACTGSQFLIPLKQRLTGYIETLQQAGYKVYPLDHSDYIQTISQEKLTEWLKQLPKPCGIYCNDDMTAFWINACCRAAGIHVPDEVALLGTEDNRQVCVGMRPALSSVNIPYRMIGYTAAGLLNDWIKTGKKPQSPVILPPTDITMRSSTETLAINDPQIKKAIRYLREHCMEEACVVDAARHAGLSSRNMQRRFKEKIGHSPYRELQLEKIRKVKTLLRETGLSVEEIAWQCNYPSTAYLSVHFRKFTGQTPSEYRKVAQTKL